jgi:hypothetical protein
MQGVSPTTTCSFDVLGFPYTTHHQQQLFSMPECRTGIQSVRYRSEQKFRCRNQYPSPVPECSGIGLKYRMPECRHRPRCRCPAMPTADRQLFLSEHILSCSGFGSQCADPSVWGNIWNGRFVHPLPRRVVPCTRYPCETGKKLWALIEPVLCRRKSVN